MWNLKKKMVQIALFIKRNRLTDLKKELIVTKGKSGGGINYRSGINIDTLPYIKWIISKALLYSTGNYTL